MVQLIYGVTDKLSILGTGLYGVTDFEQEGKLFGRDDHLTTKVTGFTDFELRAWYNVFSKDDKNVLISGGVNLPFGSIDDRYEIFSSNGEEAIVPYNMRTGSGTVDPNLGVTIFNKKNRLIFGASLEATFRLYNNKLNYRLGNYINSYSWVGYTLSDAIALVLRLDGENESKMVGSDERLDHDLTPAAEHSNYGGTKMFVGGGVNIVPFKGNFDQWRIVAEYKIPFYSNVNGTQQGNKSFFNLGIANVF